MLTKISAQTMPEAFVNLDEELSFLEYPEKFERMQEEINRNPQEPWNYWLLASIYQIKGDLDLALQNLQKSIKIDPEFSAGYGSLGRFLSDDSTQLEVALNYTNRAIDLDPSEHYYMVDRARIYLGLKRHEEAVNDALYLLNQDEEFIEAKLVIAHVLADQGKMDVLREILLEDDLSTQVFMLGTDDALFLAQCYTSFGAKEHACRCYEGLVEPYLMMDMKVPDDLAKKLKACE